MGKIVALFFGLLIAITAQAFVASDKEQEPDPEIKQQVMSYSKNSNIAG